MKEKTLHAQKQNKGPHHPTNRETLSFLFVFVRHLFHQMDYNRRSNKKVINAGIQMVVASKGRNRKNHKQQYRQFRFTFFFTVNRQLPYRKDTSQHNKNNAEIKNSGIITVIQPKYPIAVKIYNHNGKTTNISCFGHPKIFFVPFPKEKTAKGHSRNYNKRPF